MMVKSCLFFLKLIAFFYSACSVAMLNNVDCSIGEKLNGYKLGMSNESAKKIGVINCEPGYGIGGRYNSSRSDKFIYCQPSQEKRNLGSIMPDKFELVFDKDTRILANINIGNNNNGNDQATQIIDYMKSFLGEPFDVTRGMTDIKQFMWLCNDLDIRGSKYRGSHNYIVSIKFTSLPSSKNPVRKENKSSKALINQSSDLKSFESSFR